MFKVRGVVFLRRGSRTDRQTDIGEVYRQTDRQSQGLGQAIECSCLSGVCLSNLIVLQLFFFLVFVTFFGGQ